MKKFFLGLLALLLFGSPLSAFAISLGNVTSGPSSGSSAPLMGDYHSYNVTAKASGTFVVDARIVITNPEETNKNVFSFGKPDGLAGTVTAFQQVLGQQCAQVDYASQTNSKTTCLAYRDADYNDEYNYSGYSGLNKPNTYSRVAAKEEGEKLIFTLPTPIEPYKSGAILLSYYLSGQADNGLFGRKNFNFKTLTDDQVIKEVNVSVSTDSDLYTKGKKSSVKSTGGFATSSVSTLQSAESTALDSFSKDVGYDWGAWMNKTGKDILPGETFTVNGYYSTSWLGLYWPSLLITLLIVAALILGIWLLIRRAKNHPSSQPVSSVLEQKMTFRQAMGGGTFLWSLLIATAILLFSIGLGYLSAYLDRVLSFNFYSIIMVFTAVLYLIVAICLIGYPIYQAVKKGIWAAAAVIIAYLTVVIVASAISFAFLAATDNSDNSGNVSSSEPIFI